MRGNSTIGLHEKGFCLAKSELRKSRDLLGIVFKIEIGSLRFSSNSGREKVVSTLRFVLRFSSLTGCLSTLGGFRSWTRWITVIAGQKKVKNK